MDHTSRATLGSRLGAVLVAAGSSVGLGNIWRFPYVAGENGGGAFLLIYIASVLLLGLPLMVAEFSLGRATHSNAVGAFRRIDRRWAPLGYLSVLTPFLILGFYFVVAGWTAEYFVHSITGEFIRYSEASEYAAAFGRFISNPWRPLGYTLLIIAATHWIVVSGVKKGIERSSQVMMPLLFVILAVLAVHAAVMPGSGAGLRFFLQPDFSKVTAGTVLTALGQAFFSLSLGMGIMVTYASYFKQETDLRHTALQVILLDTLVAVLAGILIFPAVFSAGIEPSSGPSLVFVTLPSIFNGMPLGMVWSAVFFLLLILAALTSTISLHEVTTAYLHEEWHLSRRAAARITTLAEAALATAASLSLGVMNGWKICSMNLFDALDYLTANIMLPAGGLLTSLFVGWVVDRKVLRAELGSRSPLSERLLRIFVFLLRYLCPAILLLVFLDNLGVI